MYKTGQLIMYANTGVCRVDSIGAPPSDFPEECKERLYYRLSEVYGKNIIYIPVDTKNFMRPIISGAEAEDVIQAIPDAKLLDEKSHSQKSWEEDYKQLLNSHDCRDLVCLLKTVYRKNQIAVQKGKKPWLINQHYRQRAEKLLYGELAAALGIPFESVERYISDTVGPMKNKIAAETV